MNIKEKTKEAAPVALADKKPAGRGGARKRKVKTVIDRIFGFFLATGIVVGVACLGLEYVVVKGPSPALCETFVMTMLETRRFGFIPNIFLSEEEVAAIKAKRDQKIDTEFDSSLINISTDDKPGETDQTVETPQYNTVDEDGDGVILEDIKGNGYAGYMLTILDPKRVFVGMPDGYGGSGLQLDKMCEKYGAIGGINAGGFYDENGAGLGGLPDGLTIIGGVCYNEGYGGDSFAGFDENGILHVGYYSLADAQNAGIRDGVSFGPILIINGEAVDSSFLSSGVNPRTAIGQRADGAVLMLVIDGRQVHSIGATYQDVVDIMLDHGAVNACNMDGGSSTVMYYNGEYVNSCSSENGVCRPLPDAFLFK